jgi:large subunit ribosomal protein L25
MENITIEAQHRELLSRGRLNALRKEGWIPAVLYGGAKNSRSKTKTAGTLLKIEEKSFLKKVGSQKRSNVIVELKLGKESANAVVKEIQKDSVTRRMLHIDFQRIVMTEKLEVMVPIRFEGEAPGVKLSGGILEHIARELKISCLPKDMPAAIAVDISKLEIGQGISVKDIKEIPGVQILSDPNLLVANVVAPTVLEEAAAPAAAAAAEPEVIAKGKKPEEGQEGAVPAAGGKPVEKGAAAPATAKAGAPPQGR